LHVAGTFRTTGANYLGIGETTTLAYIGDPFTTNTRSIFFNRPSGTLTGIVNIQGLNAGVGLTDIALQAQGGNVGIGTTSPNQQLHIQKDQAAATFARIDNQSSSGSAYAGVQVGAFGNTWGLAVGSSSANSNALIFVLDPSTSVTAGEKMRLDTSGRLLVGTSSASGNNYLQIQGDAGGGSGTGGISLRRNVAPSGMGEGAFEGIIDFGPNDGGVGARIAAIADAQQGTNDYPSRLVFSTTADGASSPTERMRITNTGRILLATTVESPLEAVDVNVGQRVSLCINATDSADRRNWRLQTETNALGDICFRCSTSNTGAPNTTRVQFTSVGDAYNTTGTWGTLSDITFKQDIKDAASQWSDIKQIEFRRYRLKESVEANPDAGYLLGVIAQEVETVCPGLVFTDANGVKSIKQSILLMKAAKALQEAMERIETLEAKVAALEAA
jgi:hypothetical protein